MLPREREIRTINKRKQVTLTRKRHFRNEEISQEKNNTQAIKN